MNKTKPKPRAYYTGVCFPPHDAPDPRPYATASIQYEGDGVLDFHFAGKTYEHGNLNRDGNRWRARKILLLHFLKAPTSAEVDRLIAAPGESLCRMTPEEVDRIMGQTEFTFQ